MPPEFWLRCGAGLMFLAVSLGAFAAHGLKSKLTPDMMAIFETGVRYHVYHALALLAVGLISARWPGRGVNAAGWCFVAGVLIFSGSLYALALSGERKLGAITPIGGVLFLAGWLCLLFGGYRTADAVRGLFNL
jgi:uncharacterized membrane protein YgdD (TMEM256/DUF423 family)